MALHHHCRILHSNALKYTHGHQHDGSATSLNTSYRYGGSGNRDENEPTTSSSEGAQFSRICQSMDMLDFSDIEIDTLWRVLSTVLHLGNLVCVESSEETATTADYESGR